MTPEVKQFIAKIVLIAFISTQFLAISSVLLMPKPAHALFGIGDTTITLADIPRYVEKVLIGVLRQVATKISQKFIERFIAKMTDKYKIKNFLYYDRVLSNYYLNRFIFDKIGDPDLRQIYSMFERVYISGQPTGTTGNPIPPSAALIPQMNKAISDYYNKKYKVNSNIIYNPPANISDREYFSRAMSYSTNPESFVANNLRSDFGSFQSSATTAAQLEILLGDGLKAGRVLGGTCKINGVVQNQGFSTPEQCSQFGGTWEASMLDKARSFIDNPTKFINSNLDSVIKTQIDKDFNPNNFWVVIGSSLGNFLWNKFSLNKTGSTLEEADPGNVYQPEGNTQLDIDDDGTPDGYDIDEDGDLDICHHGFDGSGCIPSSRAINSPYYIPLCDTLDFATRELTKLRDWLVRAGQFTEEQSSTWLTRISAASGAADELQSTLIQYENPGYDTAIASIGKYIKGLATNIKSLAKDESLGWPGGENRLIQNTNAMVAYLESFKIAIGQCSDPSASGAASVPPPVIDNGDDGCNGASLAGTPDPVVHQAVEDAMAQALQDNDAAADTAADSTAGGGAAFQSAARSIITAAAGILRSQGYNAGRAIGCNGQVTQDQLIAGNFSDQYGHVYTVYTGFPTDGQTVADHFTGAILDEDASWNRLLYP